MEELTPRERVINRIQGKSVDRIPNLSILMGFAARLIGEPLRNFLLDYRVLTRANLTACERFDIDLLSVISDPYREVADLGADVHFPEEAQPQCETPLLADKSALDKLKPVAPGEGERMLDRLRAIEYYRTEAAERYPIMGWVEAPLAEAADLRGTENLMMDLITDTPFVKQLLNFCTENAIVQARAQIEAGADIIGVGDAVASIVGPELYREFALPYEQKLFTAIKQGGVYGRLHICGDITSILDEIKLSGADIIDIDYLVDFAEAVRILSPHVLISGNINPAGALLSGSPEQVATEVSKCIETGGDRCFIMPGCEVPIPTPYENLAAIGETLKESLSQKN